MPNLTWRDVAAPDISGAMQGVRDFSSLFSQSLGNLRSTVGEIDQGVSDRVNKGIMLQLAGLHDPSTARATIDGILGSADPRRISGATIAAINSRPGELLNQANQQLQFDKGTTEWGWQKAEHDAQMAAAPLRQQMLTLSQNGDFNGAQKIFDTNKEVFGKLGYNDFASTLRDAQGLASGRQSYDQSKTRFGWDTTRFGWDQQNHDAEQEAAKALQTIDATSDPAGRLEALRGLHLSPKAFQLALGGINSLPGDQASAAIAAAVTSGGGGGDGYNNFVTSLESGGNVNARNPASSATGLYQFTGDTWLGTVKQANPGWAKGLSDQQILALRTDPAKSAEMEGVLRQRNVNALTAANAPITNGNVYAAHHFGAAGGVKFAKASGDTPMSQILTPAQLAANPYLRGMTKNDALNNWTQRSGISAAQVISGLQSSAVTDQIGRATGGMQRNAGNINQDYIAAATDPNGNDGGAVMTRLLKDPRFAGFGGAFLNQKIQEVQAQAAEAGKPINAAMAAAILKQSVTSNWWTRNINSFSGGAADYGGFKVDSDKVSKLIDSYSQGAVEAAVKANASAQAGAASADGLRQIAITAAQRYQAAQIANQTQGKHINLEPLYQQMIAAAAAADQAHNANINGPGNSYNKPDVPADIDGPSKAAIAIAAAARARAAAQKARDAAARARAAQAAAAQPKTGPLPTDHSSAAARARVAQGVGNIGSAIARFTNVINPIWWAGHALDGQ